MSYVYFVQAGDIGPVKIGVASNPKKRLAQMQTSCPVPLRLLFFEDMRRRERAFEVEAILHHALAASRQHGEWFRFDSDVRWAINLYGLGVSLESIHEEDFSPL